MTTLAPIFTDLIEPPGLGGLFFSGSDWVWNRGWFEAYHPHMETAFESSSTLPGDDEQLMLKVAEGSRAAFSAIYDRFSRPLYSLALKMLANEAEAQDLLQEVFLSVWNKAATFRPEKGSAFAWVVAQMRNRAIDRLRSRRRRGELIEANQSELEPSGSVVTSSADHCEISERGRHVRSAVEQLSPEQRQVLRMAFFEGLTQVEIAEKLEEPLGTIKARAHRGMVRLRAALRFLCE
jgi:RNA polymerase sigma-70 factor, ECF subfamily